MKPQTKKPDQSLVQNKMLSACLGKTVHFKLMSGDDFTAKLRQVDLYTMIVELLDDNGEKTGNYELIYKHGVESISCPEVDVREVINKVLEARKPLPTYTASEERTEESRKKLEGNYSKPERPAYTRPASPQVQVAYKPKRVLER